MSFMYCQSCGNKIEYSLQKPNFCPKCGTSLSVSSRQITNNPAPAPQEEVQGSLHVPKITKLDFEITNKPRNDETFGSIIGRGSIGETKRKPYVPKHGSALQDSVEMCKSSKSKDIDERG